MNLLILPLFCSVFLTPAQPNEDVRNYGSNTLERHKRQEDRWDWGYVVVTGSAAPQTPTEPDTRALDSANPCLNTTYSPKPNFTALGKRISETKCYEYIWEIKHRDEEDKRATECLEYKIKNRGPNGPYFAIGGRDTTTGEFPHMGAIGWEAAVGTWVFKCGSSLISSKFVLTAAHCSRASSRDTTITDPVPKIVRLGDKNIIDTYSNGVTPTDEKIIRVIVHPQFKSPKKYYDIALMELKNDVVFTNYIQPACLWSEFDTSSLGVEATLTGWGVVESGSRTISPELQAAVVDVIDQQKCDSLLRPSCHRHWCGMQEHQLCAGKLAGGVDACQGDSGGPLQVRIPLPTEAQAAMHYIIGVTSFGIDCGLPNLPGVYTRVSSFIDWIEGYVWR